jgi:deoxyadenosine/deoxycytidine kinase
MKPIITHGPPAAGKLTVAKAFSAKTGSRVLMEYESEEEIISLVRSFEEATIQREDWKHREHLIVALFYVVH